jgi:GNAT superfamily N-acetyltransferase
LVPIRICRFLSTAYWSAGIPRDVVERSIANSLPFGLYAPSGQRAGLARVVTDRATYAYLGDVYVERPHRGRGLGKFLVACVVAHPELQRLRRWALATADARDLYARHGFSPKANPDSICFIERAPADLWPPQAEREGTRSAADNAGLTGRRTGSPHRQQRAPFSLGSRRSSHRLGANPAVHRTDSVALQPEGAGGGHRASASLHRPPTDRCPTRSSASIWRSSGRPFDAQC